MQNPTRKQTDTARELPAVPIEQNPGPRAIVAESPRAAFVAKLRDLADQLERGELDAVRAQWRVGLHHVETVERDANAVRLLRYEIFSPERPAEYREPNIGEDPAEVDRILSQVNLEN